MHRLVYITAFDRIIVDPSALRGDDFDGFFEARTQALLEKIEKAMGKASIREAVEADVSETIEYGGSGLNGEGGRDVGRPTAGKGSPLN